jgi:hypothetical protein
MRHDAAEVRHQEREHVVLVRREVDLAIAHEDEVAIEIHLEVASGEDRLRATSPRGSGRRRVTEADTDAGLW